MSRSGSAAPRISVVRANTSPVKLTTSCSRFEKVLKSRVCRKTAESVVSGRLHELISARWSRNSSSTSTISAGTPASRSEGRPLSRFFLLHNSLGHFSGISFISFERSLGKWFPRLERNRQNPGQTPVSALLTPSPAHAVDGYLLSRSMGRERTRP